MVAIGRKESAEKLNLKITPNPVATSTTTFSMVGKKVGDKVDISVPAGIIPFEIIEITM